MGATNENGWSRPGAADDWNGEQRERELMLLAELTGQERAAIIAFRIAQTGCVSRYQVKQLTGLSNGGAKALLLRISRVIPIYYDKTTHFWHICPR